jgi:hypothetical protein
VLLGDVTVERPRAGSVILVSDERPSVVGAGLVVAVELAGGRDALAAGGDVVTPLATGAVVAGDPADVAPGADETAPAGAAPAGLAAAAAAGGAVAGGATATAGGCVTIVGRRRATTARTAMPATSTISSTPAVARCGARSVTVASARAAGGMTWGAGVCPGLATGSGGVCPSGAAAGEPGIAATMDGGSAETRGGVAPTGIWLGVVPATSADDGTGVPEGRPSGETGTRICGGVGVGPMVSATEGPRIAGIGIVPVSPPSSAARNSSAV